MKQHITVKQLKQLNSDQKVCELNTLMGHQWNLTEEEYRKYSWYKILEDTAKHCTTGRMIELLSTQAYFNVRCENIDDVLWCEVKFNKDVEHEEGTEFEEFLFDGLELVDCLWEAVKEVL